MVLLPPADVVNTHILIMSFISLCKYRDFETDACSQRRRGGGMEQTRDDGRADSHTSKICLAKLSVPGAMATPSAMSRKLPRFTCERLLSINTLYGPAFPKHLDSGWQMQMSCIYLGVAHISMTLKHFEIGSFFPLG